jgi:hypothetical protein
VHQEQVLVDVVSFLPTLGERGAGQQSVPPGVDLCGDRPPGELAGDCPWVKVPHRGLQSLVLVSFTGVAAQWPDTNQVGGVAEVDWLEDGSGPMGGARR